MSERPNVELVSNVKNITSGVAPSQLDLPLGFIAFGEVNGEYRIFGNSDGEIVDLTNFVVVSEPNTLKGRLGSTGPTQDLPFDQLRIALDIPNYQLVGDVLYINSNAPQV